MTRVIFLGILFCFITHCDGTKCFECKNISLPRDCTQLTTCNPDEYCFTEQVATSSGNLVYNSGCLHKSQCFAYSTPLVGRRGTNFTNRRFTDLTKCRECCVGDHCNTKGCGANEIPIEQRGPYCYTCDVLDPKACNAVAVCAKNEVCMIYNPIALSGLPYTIYRGQCETQAACDVVSKIYSKQKCVPMCCNTDFCNGVCGTSPNVNMTTSSQLTIVNGATTMAQSTAPPDSLKTTMTFAQSTVSIDTLTRLPEVLTTDGSTNISTGKTTLHISTTPANPPASTSPSHSLHCEQRDNYMLLHNAHAQLCVHIMTHHELLSWNGSQASCKRRGGDLVVLDTHAKALLLRKVLESHSQYNQQFYWIGAKDFKSNDHFSWVDGHALHTSAADWAHGEPDNFKHGLAQDCVSMYKYTDPSYQWHDKNCNLRGSFICERK